ncbi:MAG: hypothetical protein LBU37_08375 [Tannerellaceae bacterium]|jgi:hypothetical protein|nr:hypothetical protein [Tannerellaceae bacterium]
MKILKYILFCMLLAGLSCRNNNPADVPISSLEGTNWKLAGAVNVETGKLNEFEPKACAECFTLAFNSDHEASGRSVLLEIKLDLLDLRKYGDIRKISEGSWAGDPSLRIDGDRFRVAMASLDSFTATSKELKLFYNNKTEYLLFKRIQP